MMILNLGRFQLVAEVSARELLANALLLLWEELYDREVVDLDRVVTVPVAL